MKDTYKQFWKRNLPHIQPDSQPLFISYILKLDIPDDIKQSIHKCKQSQEDFLDTFMEYDDLFDKYKNNEFSLMNPLIADMVYESILYMHEFCILHAFTIMSNHVHLLMTIKGNHSLAYIMQNHKRFTARKANEILGGKGQFWNHEYYDHYVRNEEEFYSIVWYILNNPVKANLVREWSDWKHTWIDKEIKDCLV